MGGIRLQQEARGRQAETAAKARITGIPAEVARVMQLLNAAGKETAAVGGCVRDRLLKKQPKDWDLATAARPEETQALLQQAGYRVIPTGIRYGTVTALMPGGPVEITTFRLDGAYSDARRPDAVVFTGDLRRDLARRDFTINAMACNMQGELLDCFGGQRDLRAGLIRCVGEPDRRFAEDALRMMRALRFAAGLDFTLEAQTARSLRQNCHRLAMVAPQRLRAELDGLLCGKGAGRVLEQDAQVLCVLLPELKEDAPGGRAYWQALPWLNNLPPQPVLRLAALLHGVQDVSGALARLGYDNAAKARVALLASLWGTPPPQRDAEVRRLLGRMPPEAFFQLALLKQAEAFSQQEKEAAAWRGAADLARRVLQEGQCFRLKDLAVKGEDLLAAGVPAGPAVGRVLHALLKRVIEGELPNEKHALLQQAARLLTIIEERPD